MKRKVKVIVVRETLYRRSVKKHCGQQPAKVGMRNHFNGLTSLISALGESAKEKVMNLTGTLTDMGAAIFNPDHFRGLSANLWIINVKLKCL
jgi:hypothetical protein